MREIFTVQAGRYTIKIFDTYIALAAAVIVGVLAVAALS